MTNKLTIFKVILNFFLKLTLVLGLTISFSSAFANPKPEGQELIKSKRDKKGKFINPIPTDLGDLKSMIKMIVKSLKGGHKDTKPPEEIPVIYADKYLQGVPSDSLRFVWLGHSTIVLEIEGRRLLFDPMFSERASMVQFAGPKRFHPVPLDLGNLPRFDAVIISHNHYDHLDEKAIKLLNNGEVKFYVPLGIKDKLLEWGVEASLISELDWWDEVTHDNITLACTPARHFSGRSILDTNRMLWCSWVVKGENYRVYFSGDTGIMPVFKDIGDVYGEFDLTFLKIGAYDELWHDIHLNPPEAVDAHQQLRGKIMVPIHYGSFDLAYHAWYDPPEWLIKEAEAAQVKFLTPRIGEAVDPGTHTNEFWWREVK